MEQNRARTDVSSEQMFDQIVELCVSAVAELDEPKQKLTERVVQRCLQVAEILNLSEAVTLQLELAARVHRLGELYIPSEVRNKCFLDMTNDEFRHYRLYPIYSAMRLTNTRDNPVYDIVLCHREYLFEKSVSGDGNYQPLAARILCVCTEYEELLHYRGKSALEEHAVQKFVMKNLSNRYDNDVVEALMLSIAEQNTTH